jgi:cysteine synthase
LAIIEAAERDGTLKPGDTVIEATSGNTGIGLAMICAERGYNCVITMTESFSVERRRMMRMLGAKVIVTPRSGRGVGMVEKAHELAAKHGWFLCRQFENQANWKVHYDTTGPEICNDLKIGKMIGGGRLDYFVTGYGTGGTFHGAAKYIKQKSPETKVVLAEPTNASLVASGVPTERYKDGSARGTHPAFRAHQIQGWTPDFIPLVLEQGMEYMDDFLPVSDEEAIKTCHELAKKEGILTGISGGATMWAAIETAKKAQQGSVIVAILPDTGERYMSTPLFAPISSEMNEEEIAIANSTPGYILEHNKRSRLT